MNSAYDTSGESDNEESYTKIVNGLILYIDSNNKIVHKNIRDMDWEEIEDMKTFIDSQVEIRLRERASVFKAQVSKLLKII